MKPKRLAFLLLLGSLVFLVTGCEWMRWLRLLAMKKQFAQLERYVRADETADGLTLHFLKPVVYADDLRLLVADETAHATNGNRQTWTWTYEKQSLAPQAAAGEFDLSFRANFDNLRFSELFFPKRFLAVLPKPLILGMLRSIGQAEIDIKHGSFKFKWAGSDKEKVELPGKAQMLALLGPPFTVTETNQTQTFLYKYYQNVPTPESPSERLAWARFTYGTNSDQVLSSQGSIGNMGWTLTAVPGQSELRVTVSLVDLTVEPVTIKLPSQVTDEYLGQYKAANGLVLNIGGDGNVFVASWQDKEHGGWCTVLPEATNAFFAMPSGYPAFAFFSDNHGAVTGLLAHLNGLDQSFAKLAGPPSSFPPIVRVDAQACKDCAGTYKASWGGRVFIRNENGHLFWQNAGIRAKLPLYPASETNFFFKLVDSPLTFVKNEKGAVTKFVLHHGGKTADAEKLKAP